MAKKLTTLPKDFRLAPVHKVHLNVMDLDIVLKPYTIEQEKIILTALEAKKPAEMLANYMMIMKDCLLTEIDYDNLSLVDFFHLVIMLRAKSSDENIELQRKECSNPECKRPYDFSVNTEKALIVENADKKKAIVEVTDNLTFELMPTKFFFLAEMDETKDEYDVLMDKIAYSTSKIVIDKDIYADLEPSDIKETILKQLTKAQLLSLYKGSEEMINLSIEIKSTCPFCKQNEVEKVQDFLGFGI